MPGTSNADRLNATILINSISIGAAEQLNGTQQSYRGKLEMIFGSEITLAEIVFILAMLGPEASAAAVAINSLIGLFGVGLTIDGIRNIGSGDSKAMSGRSMLVDGTASLRAWLPSMFQSAPIENATSTANNTTTVSETPTL